MSLFETLATEGADARSKELDAMTSIEFARLMNEFNLDCTRAVDAAIPAIARAIEEISDRLALGGRMLYLGAGTSGRLGVLDASECPPTFGVDEGMVVGIIAGGDRALRSAVEGAEDDMEAGATALDERGVTDKDAVVAISASGYAPYCIGALRRARTLGALAVAVSCNQNAPQSSEADIAIEAPTGPEMLSGSTRLKAGTATKLILNMLSTGVMARLGKVYKNLMVDVRPTNAKLRDRAVRIVMAAAGISREAAEAALREAGSVKVAIVMSECRVGAEEARAALEAKNGFTRAAIALLSVPRDSLTDRA